MTPLPLPLTPANLLRQVITPALKLLPPAMTSIKALVMLVAIALQESALKSRWQIVDANNPNKKGPARNLWQFELGSKTHGGGVWGVFLHPASRYWLAEVCKVRGVEFQPRAIWLVSETDDVLACCLARLLLFTDRKALPEITDTKGGWDLYRYRTWCPGKPKALKWAENHAIAVKAVSSMTVAK